MELACFNNNTAGLLLYPKLGFEAYAIEQRQGPDSEPLALIQLRLTLKKRSLVAVLRDHMHILLRIRNTADRIFQSGFRNLRQIKKNTPIVASLRPAALIVIDRAVGQRDDHRLRRRIVKHSIVRRHEAKQGLACLVDIVVIGDATSDINPARIVARIVDDL